MPIFNIWQANLGSPNQRGWDVLNVATSKHIRIVLLQETFLTADQPRDMELRPIARVCIYFISISHLSLSKTDPMVNGLRGG
jgi:hypothetical protein